MRSTQLSLRPSLVFRTSPDRPLQAEVGFGIVSSLTRERVTGHTGPSEPDESWGRTLLDPTRPSIHGALLTPLGPGLLELGSAVDVYTGAVGPHPNVTLSAGYRWVL